MTLKGITSLDFSSAGNPGRHADSWGGGGGGVTVKEVNMTEVSGGH